MDNDFGVGMSNYLFSQQGSNTQGVISSRIKEQVTKYMPYISIISISFDDTGLDMNKLSTRIEYVQSDEELVQIFDLEVRI